MSHRKENLTTDEAMMLMLYFHNDRSGTIDSLRTIRKDLSAEETELISMTDALIRRLEEMTDEEFFQLEPIRSINN